MYDVNVLEFISVCNRVAASGKPNVFGCRVPVPSNFNIDWLRSQLVGYQDAEVAEFLAFGWPINFEGVVPSAYSSERNHRGATDHKKFFDVYFPSAFC